MAPQVLRIQPARKVDARQEGATRETARTLRARRAAAVAVNPIASTHLDPLLIQMMKIALIHPDHHLQALTLQCLCPGLIPLSSLVPPGPQGAENTASLSQATALLPVKANSTAALRKLLSVSLTQPLRDGKRPNLTALGAFKRAPH